MVLEKILENPLDCKEIQPVCPKSVLGVHWKDWFEADAPILWPPDVKNWFTGKDPNAVKDWRQEEKGTTEDVMAGWHHQFDGDEFEQTLEVLVIDREAWWAIVHGVTKRQTWLSNWTELICIYIHTHFFFKQERKSLDKIAGKIYTLVQISVIHVQWYYTSLRVPCFKSKHKQEVRK